MNMVEAVSSDSLVTIKQSVATPDSGRQISLNAAVDGRLSMSYFNNNEFGVVNVGDLNLSCRYFVLSTYFINLSGEEKVLYRVTFDFVPPPFHVQIGANRFREWWSASNGEGTRSVRWRLQLDAVFTSGHVIPFTQHLDVSL